MAALLPRQLSVAQLQLLLSEQQALVGQRLDKVRQHSPSSLSLQFGKAYLLLDLAPAQNLLAPSVERPPSQEPHGWVMLLRRSLQGRRLSQLRFWDAQGECQDPQTPDRVLLLDFSDHQLVLEMLGRHANAFLLQQGQVMGQWRADRSRRQLRLHQPYLPPLQPAEQLTHPPRPLLRGADLATAYLRQQERLPQQQFLQAHLKLQSHQIKRVAHQLKAATQALDSLHEVDQWRRRGELLQGAYGNYQPGLARIEVLDYWDPAQQRVSLPLNPALDLQSQIHQAFRQAQKREKAAERALEQIPLLEQQISSMQQRLQALQADLTTLQAADAQPFEAALWSQKLKTYGPLPLNRQLTGQTSARAQNTANKDYRVFYSQAGQEIWVGRNDQANERLSFRWAHGNDLWLHVQDAGGSHVVIPLRQRQALQSEWLLDAASLAHHFSQARAEPKVTVIYTPVKQLKRLKGGKAGQVQLGSFKTLLLQADTTRLQRLLSATD